MGALHAAALAHLSSLLRLHSAFKNYADEQVVDLAAFERFVWCVLVFALQSTARKGNQALMCMLL